MDEDMIRRAVEAALRVRDTARPQPGFGGHAREGAAQEVPASTAEMTSSPSNALAVAGPSGIQNAASQAVRTTLWMKGRTCGICGHSDSENLQEFQMPDGNVARDEASFLHSWIPAEEACSGACKLQRTMVKLEKSVDIDEYESKCYSVQPVLRCIKGCSPVSTTPVSVGFHCLPADASTDFLEGQTKIDKPEDLFETVDAHTECSCESLKCN
ncbi:vitellogenin-A2-like [Bombina bombina]|uniref:vitellogenin-A2-like n=1 Tax=Bombina bombina TaxID=8345 RepID=UPI00235AFF38|nr:vitellogenin-A2-like [Bombina bombina]